MTKVSSMSKDSNNLSKPYFGCYFCHSVVTFLEHMDYLWFIKKLKKYCVWFRRYKIPLVIRDLKSLNSIPGYDACFGWRARFHIPPIDLALLFISKVHGMPYYTRELSGYRQWFPGSSIEGISIFVTHVYKNN